MVATVISCIATATAVVILGVRGHGPATVLVLGLIWGILPVGWVIAALTFLAPTAVIKWRHEMMVPTSRWRRPVGLFFSERLGIAGDRPWESRAAAKRVRRFGLSLLLFWGVVFLVLVSAPPFTDRLSR